MNSTDTPHRGWKFLRRLLLTLAVIATAIALFYAEEDWRGKRDWERYKSELEAQGWVLDWSQRIPKPVPDDQNFFTASTNTLIRFVKFRSDAEYRAATNGAGTNLNWPNFDFQGIPEQRFTKSNEPVVAEITMIPPNHKDEQNSGTATIIDLRSTNAGESLRNLIIQHLGHGLQGAAGFPFSEKDVSHLPPLQITLTADTPPTGDTLNQLIPANLVTNIGGLGIESGDHPGQFEVRLVAGRSTPAAQYLQWSERFTPAFDEIRAALKRPYALIPGDYSQPWYRPIPNFVAMRWLAQTLAMRAQCHLMLNQPGQAVEDLTLVHDICRILEHQPEGHPMTLVEAMINVAIHGLYVSVVQKGFSTHTWRDQDLAALQKQMAQTDLHASVFAGFEEEQLSTIYNGERPDFLQMYINNMAGYEAIAFHIQLQAWLYRAMPRGWGYENIKVAVQLYQMDFTVTSRTNQQVFPSVMPKISAAVDATLRSPSPFNILSGIAIPNFEKAFETYAYNQTLLNEGQIACALERYKLANGAYPNALDELTPAFIQTRPPDVIGGQPLHYHRTEDGNFLLYSVGWNEKDDGGTIAHKGKGEDRDQGDWVWHYSAN